MKLHIWSLYLVTSAVTSSALKVSFKKSSAQRKITSGTNLAVHTPSVNAVVSDNNGLDLSTVRDLIYIANVTIGGSSYPVQLDTGSSDLWIKGETTPLPNSHQTSTTLNLTYGIGWAQGHLSYAPVEFAGISVDSQAFLDASSVQNPALSYGAVGILGLGFTSLSSLDASVSATGSSAGRSLLFNLFEDNPSQPNFISFALQRSTEPGDEVEGSFSIGEYEPAYASVAQKPPISTWPVNSPTRWTVLLDALLVGDKAVTPSTTVPNVPSNRALILLDSGTSWTYAPKAICDAIYAGVAGASYSTDIAQWVVPCDAEIDIALQIGGQVFPVHPLDVAPASLGDSTICVGSFLPQSVSVGAGEFDWLVGDNVLRSVYSVYDFGDSDANNNKGNPYVRLLSIVDPNQASSEFVKVRGGTAKTNITYNSADSSNADPGSTSVTLSTKTLDKIGQYFPAMLGVMALNALVLIALLIVGIVYLCRRRRNRARTVRPRSPNGRMTPMPINSRNSYIAGTPPVGPHMYEPVSMAITEDTMFVPPSPGFRQFDGQAGDRPKSLAMLPSQSNLYQKISSEDALFPPTPGFGDNNRPKSMGMAPSSQDNIYPAKDQRFTPPALALHQVELADNTSLRSGKSGHSLADDGVVVPALSSQSNPEDRPSSRPVSVFTADRPRSILIPPPTSQSSEEILLPPSPGHQSTSFSGGLKERPQSAAIPASQAPKYPPPQAPHSAAARFGGSSLRLNANFAGGDRPMSVGILPSQFQGGDMRFASANPAFHRQGSSLRPNAGSDRPMSVGIIPSQSGFRPAEEEDITTFTPPTPAFRRSPGGGSSANDRPMSMA